MSKRLYLSDIVNDPELGWVAVAVRDAGPGVRIVSEIETDENGVPLHTQAMCYVASKDHARFRSMQGVDALPDFPLDGKVNAINAGTINALKQVLTRRGLPAGLMDGKDGYREVIRDIGRRFNPAFDENKFDVTDV